MNALIFNGKVVQIETDIFPVASALEWVDIDGITPAPEVGWFYDGVVFTSPPPPPPPPTNDEIYDQVIKNQKVLKAVVLSINDGTLVPGANVSNAALKTTVRANM